MQETTKQIIASLGVSLALTCISLLLSYATLIIKKGMADLRKQIEAKAGEEKKQNILKSALEQLDVLAENTVGAIEQQVAKDLRLAVKNGVKDRQELIKLSQQAFASICEKMKPEYLAALENNIANVEGYINDVIEANVLKAKSYDTANGKPSEKEGK